MKTNFIIFRMLSIGIILLLLSVKHSSAQQQVFSPTKVTVAIQHDTSPPLYQLIAEAKSIEVPSGPPREMRSHDIPEKGFFRKPLLNYDPVLQTHPGSLLPLESTIVSFDGINNLCGCLPPDPNGDIGPGHYIQTVNTHFAIYDRSGNLLQGPALLSTLWDGFPGPWSGRNDGDPIVLYDHLAERWIVTQFAIIEGAPDYELVAVSQTSDPLGSWNRYAFEFADFPDYPKLAIWPDAYYLTFNRFNDAGTQYLGMAAVALERDAMLSGQPARMVLFTNFTDHAAGNGLLPSDLDGEAPPANTPNYFAYVVDGETQGGNDRIGIYELQVDWNNPSNSTFTGPTLLSPAPFNRLCAGTRNCVPQQGPPRA